MEEVIKGEELIQIMNSTCDELTKYKHLNKPGYCGFFINNECLYVFGGTSLINRLFQELGCCIEQKVERSMRYILLNKHLIKTEWRVLEFTNCTIEKRSYWIAHYDNPIFNIGTRRDGYHAVQLEQFEQFVAGELTIADLKALTDNPELNKTVWTIGTKLQTVRKNGFVQGVYMIRNKNDDTKYIGSSTDVEGRWKSHIRHLKNGTHHSYKLQQAYDILGDINAFEFSLIENVSNKQRLYDREQYWTDYYNTYQNGYNCTAKADCTDKHEKYQSLLHNEDEVDKFKCLYHSYENSLHIPDTPLRRISNNEWRESSVARMNKAIEWYLNHFNVEHTKMFIHNKLDESSNRKEWFIEIYDAEVNIQLFCGFLYNINI